MKRATVSALVALALLAGAPHAPASARPFTIADLLSQESFGAQAVDPSGRWFVFEQRGPYDQFGRYDTAVLPSRAAGRLQVVDLDRDDVALRGALQAVEGNLVKDRGRDGPAARSRRPAGEAQDANAVAEADLGREAGRDVGWHDVLAAGAGHHRVDDLLAARLLRDEPGGAGLERLVDDAAVRERGDEQDACRKLLADYRIRDRDAVELGKLVVEQRDVGLVLVDLGKRRAPVLRFGDDVDLAAGRQCTDDPFAVERVVVGDDDANALRCVLRHRWDRNRTSREVCVRLPVCIVATISRLGEACGAHEVDASARKSQAIEPPITAPVAAALRTIGSARVIGMRPFRAH